MILCIAVVLGCMSPISEIGPDDNPNAKPRKYLWRSGNEMDRPLKNIRYGDIDDNGNFVPDQAIPLRSYQGYDNLDLVQNNLTGGIKRYEHRTNALIPGWAGEVDGYSRFIPEIGMKVLSLCDHSGPGKVDRITYNRVESIRDFWSPERKLKYPNGLPKDYNVAKTPSKAGVPAGWKLVSFEEAYAHQFSNGARAWFVRIIGNTAEYGHIDSAGDFVPDYGLPVMKRQLVPQTARLEIPITGVWHFAYTLPRNGAKTEAVYEYRSGRLIKGTLHDTGNFAPEIGSTILDFKEYDPESTRRIYNLPGVLIRKKATPQ